MGSATEGATSSIASPGRTSRPSDSVELAAVADSLAQTFALRAADHDRDGTFVFDNFDRLVDAGLVAATVPARFGGHGVQELAAVADILRRIARGCPSTSLALTMHLMGVWVITKMWASALLDGDRDELAETTRLLRMAGERQLLVAFAGAERGGSALHPTTSAKPCDDGWQVNGLKSVVTGCEVAGLLLVSVVVPSADGESSVLGIARVPVPTTGVEIRPTWDALGMRGSGSHEVSFTGCQLPRSAVRPLAPTAHDDASMWRTLAPMNFPLLATFVGIAESALDTCLHDVANRVSAPRVPDGLEQQVASAEVSLYAARSALNTCGRTIDEHLGQSAADDPEGSRSLQIAKELQCAKLVITRSTLEVVDTCMEIVGGKAYGANHPLSRAYRDVRAIGFMQPFSPGSAREFIGKIAVATSAD